MSGQDYPQGLGVPSRAKEKFFEGDLRTWWHTAVTQDNQTVSEDLWEEIPPGIRNEIAEVLELYFGAPDANITIRVDGALLVPINWNTITLSPIPIHRPRFELIVENIHASANKDYFWGIRYRRKAPGVQGD